MIPVKTHLDAVKTLHQKKVQSSAIKDLDNLVNFEHSYVATIAKSDIPYDIAKSENIYSFQKSTVLPSLKKIESSGHRNVHHCGSAVPISSGKVPPKDVIKKWQQYYNNLKAKKQKQMEDAILETSNNGLSGKKDLSAELSWDEHALSLVSKNMQEFVTYGLTERNTSDYYRLSRKFITKHGKPQEADKIGLIENLFEEKKRFAGKKQTKWMKQELQRLLPAVSSEPNLNINKLSGGQIKIEMKAKKEPLQKTDSRSRIRKSSSAVIAKEEYTKFTPLQRWRSASPRPTFFKELVSGSRQVYESDNLDKITFSSGKQFKKKLQPVFPDKYSASSSPSKSPSKHSEKFSGLSSERAPSRGHRRWIEPPDFVEENPHMILKPLEIRNDSEYGETNLSGRTTRFSQTTPEPPNREGTRSRMENYEAASLRAEMAADWRNKWRITIADTTDPKELLDLLSNMHPFTRIRGIVTVGYIAHGQHSSSGKVPSYLLKAVECMLTSDTDENVCKAAAFCLASLGVSTEDVKSYLTKVIRGEDSDSADKWTAAQGLAHNQVYNSDVISVFINIYVDNYSPDGADDPRRDTALKLLRVISSGSALVAGMAGELLANSDWDVRRSACHMIGSCHGPLPVDVVGKLNQLMWTDWSEPVRIAAAHTLGKTGHGLDVHHELVARLQSKHGSDRARALRLISIVGFMTVRLMPLYLNCFRDTYTDVREAACTVASRLYKVAARSKSTIDHAICERLIEILQFDTAPAVHLSAMNALENCVINLDATDPHVSSTPASSTFFKASPTPNQKLRSKIYASLVWALQTVPEPEIRLRSLRILREHNYSDVEFAEILRQRILAEADEQVKASLETSLEDCLKRVHSASRQMPLMNDLRKNIRELSTSTSGIVVRLEKIDERERLHEFKEKYLASASNRKRSHSKNNFRPIS